MAYTALATNGARKTFAELVGQEHVRRALMNALESGGLHHAFLFTGTRAAARRRSRASLRNASIAKRASPPIPAAFAVPAGDRLGAVGRSHRGRRGIATKVDDTREIARQRAVLADTGTL